MRRSSNSGMHRPAAFVSAVWGNNQYASSLVDPGGAVRLGASWHVARVEHVVDHRVRLEYVLAIELCPAELAWWLDVVHERGEANAVRAYERWEEHGGQWQE